MVNKTLVAETSIKPIHVLSYAYKRNV